MGAYMASADEIYITLSGPGGHGALPHQSVDLVAVMAQLVSSLQQVVSRKAPAGIPTVLSFGRVNTDGGATNVLPARLEMAGTFRTYDEAWRQQAHAWIRQIVEATASMFGAEVVLNIKLGYPALYNDPAVTAVLRMAFGQVSSSSSNSELRQVEQASRAGFGASTDCPASPASPEPKVGKRVVEEPFAKKPSVGKPFAEKPAEGESSSRTEQHLPSRQEAAPGQQQGRALVERVVELALRPTAEDFAWYLQQVPGSFFRLGVGNVDAGITAGVHTATFDVDEDCLAVGAFALALAALQLAHDAEKG